MRKKIVYLPIEVSQRELQSNLFYASILLGLGCDVVVLNNWLFKILLEERVLPAGLVIDKDMTHRAFFQRIQPAKSQGFIYSTRVLENFDHMSLEHLNLYSDPRSVSLLDFYFYGFDGEKTKLDQYFSSLESTSSIPHLVPVIEPRVFLLSNTAKNIFSNFTMGIQQLYQKNDFTIISLSSASSLDFNSYLVSRYRQIKNFYKGSQNPDILARKYFDHTVAHDSLLIAENKKFIKSIVSITKKFSDTHFLVRPHPATRSSGLHYLNDLYTSNVNLEIIGKGAFEPWQLSALIHVSPPCTTLLCSSLSNNTNSIGIASNNSPLRNILFSANMANSYAEVDKILTYSSISEYKNACRLNSDIPLKQPGVSLETTILSIKKCLEQVPDASSMQLKYLAETIRSPLPHSVKFHGFNTLNNSIYKESIKKLSQIIFQDNKDNFDDSIQVHTPTKDIMFLIHS